MAIINKTGITDGGTIQAEHVTRAIDALSGVSTDTIVATGSFSGSVVGTLTGTASFANTASFALNAAGSGFPYSGSAVITGSLLVSGSTTAQGGLTVFDSDGNTSLRISGTTTKILFNGTVPALDWNPGFKGVHITEFLQLEIVSTAVNPNSMPSGSIMLSGSANDYNMYVNMAGGWKQIAFV